jgi:hypothetical protein
MSARLGKVRGTVGGGSKDGCRYTKLMMLRGFDAAFQKRMWDRDDAT